MEKFNGVTKQFELEQRNNKALEYLQRKAYGRAMDRDQQANRLIFWIRTTLTILSIALFLTAVIVTSN